MLINGGLTRYSFMALVLATFFFGSAGASAAYLTVSEVFPMETRALAIALFYAVGTAVGGIAGPLLFGQLIHTGDPSKVAIGFFIGAGAMALGGVAEIFFGVRAEQQSLENIAKPLTAEEAEAEQPAPAAPSTDADVRIRSRHERKRRGLRRVRPGPGGTSRYHSPGMVGTAGTASGYAAASDACRDREIEEIVAGARGRAAPRAPAHGRRLPLGSRALRPRAARRARRRPRETALTRQVRPARSPGVSLVRVPGRAECTRRPCRGTPSP
jgi:hypothetical protein